jgi:hypothetical protein
VPLSLGILLATSVAVDLSPLDPLEGARIDADQLHGHLLVRLAEAGYGVRSASAPADCRLELRMGTGDRLSLRAVGAQVREADVELGDLAPAVLHLGVVQRALLLLEGLPSGTIAADRPTVFIYFPAQAGDASAMRSYERAAIALVERGFELVGKPEEADRLACMSAAGEPVWIAAGEAASRCRATAPALDPPRPGEGGPRIDSLPAAAESSPAPVPREQLARASWLREVVAEARQRWQAQARSGEQAIATHATAAQPTAAQAAALQATTEQATGDRPASSQVAARDSIGAVAESLWALGASAGVMLRDSAVDPVVDIQLRRGHETGFTLSATGRVTRSAREGIGALELGAAVGPGWRFLAGSIQLDASLQAGVLAYQLGRWGEQGPPQWDWMVIAPLDVSWRIGPSLRARASASYGLVGEDRVEYVGIGFDRRATWSREHLAIEVGINFDF